MDARKFNRKRREEVRERKIEIPLSEEEKDKIISMAKAERLPVATYIRWKILKGS